MRAVICFLVLLFVTVHVEARSLTRVSKLTRVSGDQEPATQPRPVQPNSCKIFEDLASFGYKYLQQWNDAVHFLNKGPDGKDMGFVSCAPLKKKERSMDKINEYQSNPICSPATSCLLDLLRCAVVYDNAEKFLAGVANFKNQLAKLNADAKQPLQVNMGQLKNRFKNSKTYSDLLSNFKISFKGDKKLSAPSCGEWHIAELQFHLKGAIAAKEGAKGAQDFGYKIDDIVPEVKNLVGESGHGLYEESRNIDVAIVKPHSALAHLIKKEAYDAEVKKEEEAVYKAVAVKAGCTPDTSSVWGGACAKLGGLSMSDFDQAPITAFPNYTRIPVTPSVTKASPKT